MKNKFLSTLGMILILWSVSAHSTNRCGPAYEDLRTRNDYKLLDDHAQNTRLLQAIRNLIQNDLVTNQALRWNNYVHSTAIPGRRLSPEQYELDFEAKFDLSRKLLPPYDKALKYVESAIRFGAIEDALKEQGKLISKPNGRPRLSVSGLENEYPILRKIGWEKALAIIATKPELTDRDLIYFDFALRIGADPNVKDMEGLAPDLTTARFNYPILNVLIARKEHKLIDRLLADERTELHSKQGLAPLSIAILFEDTWSIERLLRAGADPDLISGIDSGSPTTPRTVAKSHKPHLLHLIP